MSNPCPICGYQSAIVRRNPNSWEVECESCGHVLLKHFFSPVDLDMGKYRPTLHLMAGTLRRRRLRNEPMLIVTPDAWDGIVAQAPRDFPERVDQLLVNLALASSSPGSNTSLSTGRDRPLAYAESRDGLTYALTTLRDQGLIDLGYPMNSTQVNDTWFRLTYAGWKRYRDLERDARDSDRAFVAMTRRPDGKNLEPRMEAVLREGLEAGIKGAGYHPIFMEDLDHADRIDDRILVEIARSRFMVADTTGRNPNVTFEAGHALGLKRPVLWTCRDGDHDEQAFDIRQYKRILWRHGEERKLAERLRDAILNVIGPGPHSELLAG